MPETELETGPGLEPVTLEPERPNLQRMAENARPHSRMDRLTLAVVARLTELEARINALEMRDTESSVIVLDREE